MSNIPTEKSETMSLEEVMNALGVGRATVYRWAEEKMFPSFKLGRRLIVRRDLFEAWLAQKSEPNQDAA